jgi:hypothetical protein
MTITKKRKGEKFSPFFLNPHNRKTQKERLKTNTCKPLQILDLSHIMKISRKCSVHQCLHYSLKYEILVECSQTKSKTLKGIKHRLR